VLWDDQAVQDALDGKSAPTKAPPAPAGDAPLGGPGAFAGGRPGESERPAEVLGKQLKISNRGALEAARNWGEKSDILRYEILAQFGGLYVDTDFECLAPMDDLMADPRVTLFTGRAHTAAAAEVNNGLIGARPQHPLLKAARRRIEAAHNRARALEAGSQAATRISHFLGPALGGGLSTGPALGLPSAANSAINATAGKPRPLLPPQVRAPGVELPDGGAGGASSGTIARTGPGLWTKLVLGETEAARGRCKQGADESHQPSSQGAQASPVLTTEEAAGVLVLPIDWFYPVPNTAALDTRGKEATGEESYRQVLKEKWRAPNTRAVHYWERSWVEP